MKDLTDEQVEAVTKVAEYLFASAVAQGMHAPFALDAEYWGRQYTERLFDAIAEYDEGGVIGG